VARLRGDVGEGWVNKDRYIPVMPGPCRRLLTLVGGTRLAPPSPTLPLKGEGV